MIYFIQFIVVEVTVTFIEDLISFNTFTISIFSAKSKSRLLENEGKLYNLIDLEDPKQGIISIEFY